MPRRKQDAPQRLKYKDSIEQTSSSDRILEDTDTKEINQENEKKQIHDDSLNTNEPERDPEESCKREDTEKETEIRNDIVLKKSTEGASVMEVSTIFAENRLRNGNDFHVAREIESSNKNGQTPNDDTVNSNRELNTSRDDTSSLHTLAAAAEFRSTTPGATEEQQQQTPESPSSSGSSKMADSSMPIKKRGKRSLSPEETAAVSTTMTKNLGDCRVDLTATKHVPESSHMFSQAAKESMSDVVQQHANQLHLMEAMMHRQRQLYEDCTENNWMKMQRTDNNCLSKSKAKRYRWCVQKKSEDGTDENNNNNDSHHHSTVPCATRSTEHSSYSRNMKKNFAKRQVNPMHDKLYGTVFTGASKFRCRDCGNPFNTLVDLTLHMNKTGHYRDQNIAEIKGRNESGSSNFIKPKNRSAVESEEKESAEKVLKCLGCGHSFDSLQDLTVHMMKTKHYEDVPSLRFYSQKNEFCTTTNGSSQPDKTVLMSSQHINNNIPNGRSDVHSSGQRSSSDRQLTDHTNGLECQLQPSMFGGFPNLANMQALAAQSLFGFSPYMLPTMGFPGAMNAYGSTGSAFAAAAASLLLSAPWLMQVPGFGATMFPSYFNAHAPAFPPAPFPHSASPRSADDITPPLTTRSVSPLSGNHPSPMDSQTPNGSRYKEDNARSKSQILCCSQCGKSFTTLQKLTNHMREAAHFPNASTPPIDVTSFRRPESSSDSPLANHRESPRSKQQCSPAAPYTSSPLEHLAKLASGKSLGQLGGNSSNRSKFDTPSKKQHLGSLDRHSPGENSKEKYIQPENRESSKFLTGFDFIKSLETTIQSAISKVKEPTRSPIHEKKVKKQSPVDDYTQRQYVFNHYVPTKDGKRLTHQSRSQPEQPNHGKDVVIKVKKEKRPASDGEEYEQKKRTSVNYKLGRHYASPPLDLSRTLIRRKRSSDNAITNEADDNTNQFSKKKSLISGESEVSTANPIQCIENKMQTWFESNSEKASKSSRGAEKQTNDVRRTSEDDVPARSSKKESYPSLIHNHTEREKSNPLQEMQKIVNSTELSRRPESLTDVATKDERGSFMASKMVNGCRKRSFEIENNHKSESKRFKPGSILSDLVRHENDSPPTINPLAQMEHLVNLKIGENTLRNKSSHTMHLNKPNSDKLHDETTQNGVVVNELKNGTNPMTALLSLFRGANQEIIRPDSLTLKLSDEVSKTRESDDVISKPPKKAKRHREQQKTIKPEPTDKSPTRSTEDAPHKNSSSPPDETARLRDKMADFFRSMMTQDRVLCKPVSVKQEPQSPGGDRGRNSTDAQNHESKLDKSCSNSFRPLQELQLQIIFTSNFENISKNVPISDAEMGRFSSTTELSVDSIKEWISKTRKRIMEAGKCKFVKISKSKGTPKYRCTSCAIENLSAKDFLQHISTHINALIKTEFNRKSSHEESSSWKMSYRGAMRFEPLKHEDSSPSYSLTAHVTKSPIRDFSTSPPTEVSDQRRCVDGMKVTEDSPIQVSG